MPTFDPGHEDHVMVSGECFFFEPYCAEFTPPGAGSVVIAFGQANGRNRGVDVSVSERTVSIWVPVGGRVWWCPSMPSRADPNTGWEHRLVALNHETGELGQVPD